MTNISVSIDIFSCTKAFDKCKFDILFRKVLDRKLLDRKLPAVVIRVLVFVCEEQTAWVKWGRVKSRTFGILNGTRQGSVLSPALFSVYMDDLIVKLREAGVGCHMGGLYTGVVGYADDLLLMAPSGSAMEKMLNICEDYAGELNLEFSTDPYPVKIKSKCIFMCGHLNKARQVNLQLYGVDLPQVNTATHFGNKLSWECNIDQDMTGAREGPLLEDPLRSGNHLGLPSQTRYYKL
jgi:hypothetical protein